MLFAVVINLKAKGRSLDGCFQILEIIVLLIGYVVGIKH